MGELRQAALILAGRANAIVVASVEAATPEEFAKWLDADYLNRDPQLPLADLFELIAEF